MTQHETGFNAKLMMEKIEDIAVKAAISA